LKHRSSINTILYNKVKFKNKDYTLSEQFENYTLSEQFENYTLSEQFENPIEKS